MVSELSTNGEALRLFFTEDIYFVNEAQVDTPISDRHPVSGIEAPSPATVSAVPTAETHKAAVDFKFLGKNKRNILILVNDAHHEVSTEAGRELLRKIVKSVNLTADDFALLNYAKYSNADFAQLNGFFNCSVVFAFGVLASQLGLSEHPENTIVQEAAVRLVFTAGLPALNEDPNGKKALWGCLKNLEL